MIRSVAQGIATRMVRQKAGEASPTQPTSSAINTQMERILASDEFGVSERNRRFLRYVVDETLAGRADGLKAYSIAIEVFERRETFDAQNDPVVRIEARILRRALERYYLVAGAGDPIVIGIPKGGYRPTFTFRLQAPFPDRIVSGSIGLGRSRWLRWGVVAAMAMLLAGVAYWAPSPNSAPTQPAGAALSAPARSATLLIAPFIRLGDEAQAQLFVGGLAGEITARLANAKGFTIVGSEASDAGAPAHHQQGSPLRFALDGVVHALNDRLNISARLLDMETGFILWSVTYDEDLRARDVMAVKQNVAEKLATAVAEFGNVVFSTGGQ